MTASAAHILVATCGNRDRGDDGFGPAVADALKQLRLDALDVLELDIKPTALLDRLADFSGELDALIVVDAAYVPGAPVGQLLDLPWTDELNATLQHDDPLSSHGLSIAAQIELARRLGMLPPLVRLIAVAIDRAESGAPLSGPLHQSVQAAAGRIARLAHWLLAEAVIAKEFQNG